VLALLLGGVIAALIATGGWSALRPSELASLPEAVQALADRADAWGPWAFIAVYSIASMAFVPRSFLALVAGVAWGPVSALYTYVGALLGESLAFGAARGLGRGFVTTMLGARWRRWDAVLGRAGFQTVLVLRLIPLVPCDVINYGAGLGSVRFRDFILATAVGIVPGCILYAVAGHGLVGYNPLPLMLGFGGLVLLAALTLSLRRWRRAQTVEREGPSVEAVSP
jgi:uncharacterized membrane protein YdjX (TVP38/TMEM64 family)